MQMKTLWMTGLLASAAMAANVNTGGLTGLDNTYSAYSTGLGSFSLGVSVKGEYGHEALDERLPGGIIDIKDVILLSQDLFLSYGLANWMDVAMDMPFYQDMIDGFDERAAGIGDLGASIKIMHPGMRSDAVIRLAYIMRATFPTGSFYRGYFVRDPQYAHVDGVVNRGGAFTSGGWNLNPMLAWTFDLQRLKVSKPWLIHVNFGMDAMFYPDQKSNIPQDNTAMQGGLGIEWLAAPDWSVYLDFYGKSRLGNIEKGAFLEIFAKDLLRLSLGTKASLASGLQVGFAVEGSVSTQEHQTLWQTNHGGSPVRNYGSQTTPILGAVLTLGFGKTGKKADSDFDGNPNISDKCPQDAEDYDGYNDEDGCTDLVHEASVVTMDPDTVFVLKRDTVQIVKNDTIRVTVPDTLQYQGAQDPNRIFPMGKTTFQSIKFQTGSDELTRTSFKTLNDIAQSLKNFPTVSLQVLGFTDNTGSVATNQALSVKRAQAVVNYLVGQGIDSYRLEAVGKGTQDPVGSNKTADGRVLNRRVEFWRVK